MRNFGFEFLKSVLQTRYEENVENAEDPSRPRKNRGCRDSTEQKDAENADTKTRKMPSFNVTGFG